MASRITDSVGIIAQGEMAGSQTAAAFTSVKGAKWAKFKAKSANAGTVAVGRTGVTLPAGTTSSTGGWGLTAGQETDWFPVPSGDLANFFYISTNVGDAVSYIVMG